MIGYTTPKARKYSTISLGRTTLGSSAPSSEKTIEMGNSRKGSADLNSLVNNYKTEVINLRCQVCKYWEDSQACPFAETCIFAHGGGEIRIKDGSSSKYKTKLCQNFHQRDFCYYGQRCQFIHNSLDSDKSKIKPSQLFQWFGTQLMGFMFTKKQIPEKTKINSQTSLQNEEKVETFEDPQQSENSKNVHNIRSGSKIIDFQISLGSGFTKPRLYSL